MATTQSFSKLVRFALIFVVLSAIYFVIASAPRALAAPTATTRYVATTGTDTGDCSNFAAPCGSIQFAVNKSASGDTILVAQGTYTYNAAADHANFVCAFLSTNKAVVCFLDKTLTISGGYSPTGWAYNPTAYPTIIDGQNAYSGVFIYNNLGPVTNLTMNGFTIQNGRVTGPNIGGDPNSFGAGMYILKAAVTLRDMIFKANQVYGQNSSGGVGGYAAGAGLSINSSPSGSSSSLQNVTFDSNLSFAGSGPNQGGYAYGALFTVGAFVTIQNCTFTNNKATAGSTLGAGGIGFQDALGGAIGSQQSTLNLQNVTITGNQAIGGNATLNAGGAFGGGIYVEDMGAFSISDSNVSGNSVTAGVAVSGGFGAGGGIVVYNSPGTIDRVKVIGNTATGGNSTSPGRDAGGGGAGGLYLWASKGGIAPKVVTNSIIADNSVSSGAVGVNPGGGGGGVQIQGTQATLTHVTIARNQLGTGLVSGQGLLLLSDPTVGASSANVNYSIISDHTVGSSGAVAVLVQQNNTVTFNAGLFAGNTKDTNSFGGPVPPGTFNGLATMATAASVNYVSPGPPSYNYHILGTSPAKDVAVGSTTPLDIDNQNRPFNGVSDYGADEYAPYLLTAFGADGSIRLDWRAAADMVTGGLGEYEIYVTCPPGGNPPAQGACGKAISAGTQTNFLLTGVTNFMTYSIIVRARNSNGDDILDSTTAAATPTNLLLYMPLILR